MLQDLKKLDFLSTTKMSFLREQISFITPEILWAELRLQELEELFSPHWIF